ncbi:MAG: DUF5522 domain-containing protein [Actinomycetes bacterium]
MSPRADPPPSPSPPDRPAGRPLTEPHPARLPLDHPRRAEVLAAHAAALDAGELGYLDPNTGLFVLTAAYLRDRGYCCERGCRHCPYLV